jgi:dTDP-4-amino-4,6-dideoxygalactose transaminase
MVLGSNARLGRSLPQGNRLSTANGRSALLAALQAFGVKAGDRVALPAYVCDLVVAPLTVLGATPAFYSVSSELKPDMASLHAILNEGVAAALAIHYFGFEAPGIAEIRGASAAAGVKLIEDCAHALYSQGVDGPLGEGADAAIFSFRKTLPVPEGGMVVFRGEPAPRAADQWKWGELRGLAREALYAVEARSGLSIRARLLQRESVLEWARARNLDNEPVDSDPRVGAISHFLASRVDGAKVAWRRRRNYARLAERLTDLRPRIKLMVPALQDGDCPIGLPLLVEGREGLRRELGQRGIGTRMFWDVLPDEIDLERFPASEYLRDRTLVLPVHQDMNTQAVDRVADAVRAWK